ncbi:MAG: winged helix-turn-helix domain-containing protein [Candidatus Nitrosocaldus sp.]|nr:winged helix-turn-helix domain-containing protein [Candidatus Nitrosocaldus sp.]
MDIGIEDVMLILIAYVGGMIVTSLMTNRNWQRRTDAHEVYEQIIADLIARMDVIDLRLKRMDGTVPLHVEGSQSKEGSRDAKGVKQSKGDDDGTTPSDERRSMDGGGTVPTGSRDDWREGMGTDGALAITSSHGSHTGRSADGKDKDEGKEGMGIGEYGSEGDGESTVERVLSIMQEGPKTSREMEQRLGMSREHTARLMKRLYEMGYLTRDESRRPYRYMLAHMHQAKNPGPSEISMPNA